MTYEASSCWYALKRLCVILEGQKRMAIFQGSGAKPCVFNLIEYLSGNDSPEPGRQENSFLQMQSKPPIIGHKIPFWRGTGGGLRVRYSQKVCIEHQIQAIWHLTGEDVSGNEYSKPVSQSGPEYRYFSRFGWCLIRKDWPLSVLICQTQCPVTKS